MITDFVDMLFGCWHSNYSFPITEKSNTRRTRAAQATGTYVVCLDCGKEFAYDWKQMKVVTEGQLSARDTDMAPAMASKQAA